MLPRPTDVVAWPTGNLAFEDLHIDVSGFEWPAHTDNHSAWLFGSKNLVHCPDLMGPHAENIDALAQARRSSGVLLDRRWWSTVAYGWFAGSLPPPASTRRRSSV